jgi:hypothetical protein
VLLLIIIVIGGCASKSLDREAVIALPSYAAAPANGGKIAPDVDETREFLLEDLAYRQALKSLAMSGTFNPQATNSPTVT